MVDINQYKDVWCLSGEIWKRIPGYENYEASNIGRVRSVDRCVIYANNRGTRFYYGKVLSQNIVGGYCTVNLCFGKNKYSVKVHRLVALAFLQNPNNYPIINHKDENKQNNHVSNIEWCTYRHNVRWGCAIEKQKANREDYFQRKRKPIVQYSIKGDFIEKYDSMTQAYNITGIAISCISACCNRRVKTAGGYVFRYDSDNFDIVSHRKTKQYSSVVCLYLNGKFVCEYLSISAATQDFGRKKSAAISHALNGRRPTAFGYKWVYSKDYYKSNNI